MMRIPVNIKEFCLENGMHVTLVNKPGFSQSFFLCGIKAGGLDQHQKIKDKDLIHPSGCAHFLEHQMFRLHGKDVTDQFAQYSANTNAFTGFFETAYYFSTSSDPRNSLELLLYFVKNLDIDEQSVQKEKGIILSELDMVKKNPESRLMSMIYQALYHDHPVKKEVLGTREDIQNMTVEQLEQFYRLNYDPSHLYLIGVTGQDLDPLIEQIKEIEKKYLSKCKGKVSRILSQEPKEVVYPFYEKEMDLSIPYVATAIKLVPSKDPMQRFLLDLKLQITLDAFFSTMSQDYQQWLDERVFGSFSGAESYVMEDLSYIAFYAQTSKSDRFYEIIDSILKKIQTTPIDQDVFVALKNRMYAQMIRSYDRFEGLGTEIFQSKILDVGMDEQLKLIASLDRMDVFKTVSMLDLQHRSNILLKSNKSN